MDYDRTILSLRPGDSLVGRYKLVARLGRGAMGEVWKATDLELGTTVAVKLLPPEFIGSAAADERMKAEAKIGRDLAHESIVRLHDYQRDPARQNLSFLVMEFVEGRTLAEILDTKGLQPLPTVIAWARSLAAGIDYAHAKKVLHRDIKPGNVMIESATGRARLLDFGIGREIRNTMSQVSQRTDSSGTPAYMSPQQVMGENHPSNDIYSLAATLYHALAGKPPFTDGHIQTQILHKPAATIPGQPSHVDTALLAGLAKQAEQRPASARCLVEAMAKPPAASPSPGGASTAQPPPDAQPAESSRHQSRPRIDGVEFKEDGMLIAGTWVPYVGTTAEARLPNACVVSCTTCAMAGVSWMSLVLPDLPIHLNITICIFIYFPLLFALLVAANLCGLVRVYVRNDIHSVRLTVYRGRVSDANVIAKCIRDQCGNPSSGISEQSPNRNV
jgi:serine/threonine protein kinase